MASRNPDVRSQPEPPSRTDTLVASDLEYRPGARVRIRVVRREHRAWVSDDGGAVEEAGQPPGWKAVARRIGDELAVNVSRGGAISLPVVRVGPPEAEVIRRVGEASIAFYQELFELAGYES